ncbi:ATP12 family chaperone protein [Sulfitobacter guttiformis]|uniref:Chaperone required for assembly of F1-ATPase n=1 Tax=Sulfitobacter guttiformis TaxID=74349 RepID=A0A420DQL5_9RHOB|nr:ATP12 family protein [Sulfitobacter guttiformis]KIN73837.1 ATP12 chaperone protein [Sulfitobacter guttiformis KCTC 32187]RKE96470.1 chaperone required for assembly of F1-ATPase [Sulfitobacter guttiformis]
MADWKAKRFWKAASVTEADGGFAVELDGRGVKTPAKQPLRVPTRAMAHAIAIEWDSQVDIINPNTMPVTKTANAAIDKVSVQHAEVADMLAAYGDSDLLCYRADTPEELVARQNAIWNPMLDWAAEVLAVRLETRTGIMHQPQDDDAIKKLYQRTHALNAFELAAFHDLVSLSGSLVLGFAATLDAKPAIDLWTISRLDELWQEEQWGEDEDATALAVLKRDAFIHAKHMFDLSQAE